MDHTSRTYPSFRHGNTAIISLPDHIALAEHVHVLAGADIQRLLEGPQYGPTIEKVSYGATYASKRPSKAF